MATDVTVHFQKSNFFRVIHADGVYGGPTPRGLMHLAFYSERSPIPKEAIVSIESPSGPITERVTETRSGVVREIEADVMMDFAAALSFHAWLGSQLGQLKNSLNVTDADFAAMQNSFQANVNVAK